MSQPQAKQWHRSPALWLGLAASAVSGFTLVPGVGVCLAGVVLIGSAYSNRPIPFCTLAVALVGVFMARDLASPYFRPMFHNYYGRNDRMIIRRWIFTPPCIDRIGNLYVPDHTLNMAIVVLVADQEADYEQNEVSRIRAWQSIMYESDKQKAMVRLSENDDGIAIPIAENVLVIVFPDRTRLEVSLMPGQAEYVHEHYFKDTWGPRLLETLETLLGPDNPKARAVLREAQQRIAQQ